MASSKSFEELYEKHVQVHRRNWKNIMNKYPEVTAVDVNYKQEDGKEVTPEDLCIQVWVNNLSKKKRLPKMIEGCRVDVIRGQATVVEVRSTS